MVPRLRPRPRRGRRRRPRPWRVRRGPRGALAQALRQAPRGARGGARGVRGRGGAEDRGSASPGPHGSCQPLFGVAGRARRGRVVAGEERGGPCDRPQVGGPGLRGGAVPLPREGVCLLLRNLAEGGPGRQALCQRRRRDGLRDGGGGARAAERGRHHRGARAGPRRGGLGKLAQAVPRGRGHRAHRQAHRSSRPREPLGFILQAPLDAWHQGVRGRALQRLASGSARALHGGLLELLSARGLHDDHSVHPEGLAPGRRDRQRGGAAGHRCHRRARRREFYGHHRGCDLRHRLLGCSSCHSGGGRECCSGGLLGLGDCAGQASRHRDSADLGRRRAHRA
mmetsp:Transcript_118391/g.315095  ORF Transcript_118391/g.315095 Transcript_118391/m.315095 type:complete len:339 (+) Transcript_118391:1031-2047(+)